MHLLGLQVAICVVYAVGAVSTDAAHILLIDHVPMVLMHLLMLGGGLLLLAD